MVLIGRLRRITIEGSIMMWSSGRFAAGLAVVVAVGATAACSSARDVSRPVQGETGVKTHFSIAALRSGKFAPMPGSRAGHAARTLEQQGLRILQIDERRPAIVDISMLTQGI